MAEALTLGFDSLWSGSWSIRIFCCPFIAQLRRRVLRATDALVNDFAAQWLNLPSVEEVVVDPDHYPNYDESLLQAFKEETELFIARTMREDRSIVDLLTRTIRL
jgi:hypothetical protein